MRRDEVLQTLAKHRTNELVLTTMSVAQEWPAYSQNDSISMPWHRDGAPPDMGLGLAVACPDRKVLVLNGDGSMLMNLGVLVSIANSAPRNLILFVFENEIYEVTGGQPIPGRGRTNFAAMAKGAGFPTLSSSLNSRPSIKSYRIFSSLTGQYLSPCRQGQVENR